MKVNQSYVGLSSEMVEKLRLGGPAGYGSYAVEKRIGKLVESIPLAGMDVLDLGCGNGCYTSELSRRSRSVVGIDFQMSNLNAFQRAIPRVQGAGESLPFASGTFDLVTIIEVLEHTESDARVMHECYRVLKYGGQLAIFAPNKLYPFESHPCHLGNIAIGPNIPFVSWLPERLHGKFCYAKIYTKRRLLAVARDAGFELQEVGYIFPPLDSFSLPFKQTYRRASQIFEKTRLKIFGVSIFAVLRKA